MKIIGFIFALLIGFGAGIYFGFKQAPLEFIYWNGQYRAALFVADIKRLKSEQFEKMIDINGLFLNQELANHGRHLESKLSWLLFYSHHDNQKSIRHAVEYLLANPYTDIDMSKPSSWNPDVDMNSSHVKDVVQWQKDQERLISKVLNLYGSNE